MPSADDADEFFRLAEGFLQRYTDPEGPKFGPKLLDTLIQTRSYVAFMRMHPVARLLLWQQLDPECVALGTGVRFLASSSGHSFAAAGHPLPGPEVLNRLSEGLAELQTLHPRLPRRIQWPLWRVLGAPAEETIAPRAVLHRLQPPQPPAKASALAPLANNTVTQLDLKSMFSSNAWCASVLLGLLSAGSCSGLGW